MASAANEREGYLFLSLLQARVGGSMVRRVPDGDVGSLLDKRDPELARAMGLGEKATRVLVDLEETFDAGALLARLDRGGFRALTYGEEGYPERLKLAPDPPPALFVGGEISSESSVAIVGSRRATRSGLETAGLLARELAARWVCVVSGLAAGVDAAAHEGALAGGGRTVGVLGCGIDVTYPSKYKPPRGKVPCPSYGRDRGVAAGLASLTRLRRCGLCRGVLPATSRRGRSPKFVRWGSPVSRSRASELLALP